MNPPKLEVKCMFRKFFGMLVGSALLTLIVSAGSGYAYDLPRQDAKTRYFYLFGPQGNPLNGKESDEFNLYVDVPQDAADDVVIKVYDPDTGGALDAGPYPYNTEMEFSVSGSTLLDKKTFSPGSPDG